MSWLDPLLDDTVPAELAQWGQSCATLKDAWNSCDRADWLFWLAAQIARDDRERKHVAVAGAYVACRVRIRRLPPLIPTNGDLAVLWGSSVPRADSIELLNPLVSFAFATPPALVMLAAAAATLRSLGNLAWSLALAMFAIVWVAITAAIQQSRVRSVRRRLDSFDWEKARSGVSSALAKRVVTASAARRQRLASEVRAALEEPGWLRLVSRRPAQASKKVIVSSLADGVEQHARGCRQPPCRLGGTFPDFVAAWNACERPDWLAWLAAHVALNNEEQRKVLLATEASGLLRARRLTRSRASSIRCRAALMSLVDSRTRGLPDRK